MSLRCPLWETTLPYLKTRQLLPQPWTPGRVSVVYKKNVVGGSPSPPHGARFCLHIHLPGGLNHCTADGLTRCREATSHALPTVHRGCNTIHLRLMSHTARADVICATNYASISRLGLCGQALHWEKQIRLVICKMILKGPAAKT